MTREDVERAFRQKGGRRDDYRRPQKEGLHTPTRAINFNIDAKDDKSTRERGSAMIPGLYKVARHAAVYSKDLGRSTLEAWRGSGELAHFVGLPGKSGTPGIWTCHAVFAEALVSGWRLRQVEHPLCSYQAAQPVGRGFAGRRLRGTRSSEVLTNASPSSSTRSTQFIGDDAAMLQPQTITEQLATHCWSPGSS